MRRVCVLVCRQCFVATRASQATRASAGSLLAWCAYGHDDVSSYAFAGEKDKVFWVLPWIEDKKKQADNAEDGASAGPSMTVTERFQNLVGE
jgi:hypothetical protein